LNRVGERIKGWGVGEIRRTHRHGGVVRECDDSNEGCEMKQSRDEVKPA
jgi:hypothetical protein